MGKNHAVAKEEQLAECWLEATSEMAYPVSQGKDSISSKWYMPRWFTQFVLKEIKGLRKESKEIEQIAKEVAFTRNAKSFKQN